jgi:hypothetical protein
VDAPNRTPSAPTQPQPLIIREEHMRATRVWIPGIAATIALALLPFAGGQEAKKEETKEEVPSLKKPKTTKEGVRIGGYLGFREIQEKLKMTQDERVKIADAQKWHREAEDKLYADYEGKIRTILGDERFKQLAKLLDEERKEKDDKKKKPAEKKPEAKPAEKIEEKK